MRQIFLLQIHCGFCCNNKQQNLHVLNADLPANSQWITPLYIKGVNSAVKICLRVRPHDAVVATSTMQLHRVASPLDLIV